MRVTTAWWLLAASLLIAGCGGGGGGTTCTTNCVTSTLSVSAVTPANGATGVAVTSAVTATFNIPANASTITTSTFTLMPQGGSAVAATVSYSGSVATLTPTASLANNTTYTATLTTGVQSTGGTALASNYTWSFTTAPVAAPTVSSVTPANASANVAITSAVTATFSEAMNASTITGSTFTLTPQGGSAIAATVSYAASVATLTPTAALANNTTYTATVTTGVTSSAGTALAANYTWTFTTVAATVTAPQVSAVTPTSNSTGVAISTTVTATFNQAMNSLSISGSTFTLTGPGNASVQGTVAYNAGTSVATFTPTANLAYNTAYTATLTTGVTSSGAVPLAAPYTWSFTTAAPPVPTVTATVPASGATGVNVANALSATFSQPMNSATLIASTFTLTGPGNTAVTGLISYNTGTSTVTFAPGASLAYNTSYTVTITTGAQSSAGAPLASNYTWTFTTGASPNQVTVDFGAPQQTIRGFGGSTAWLGEMPSAVATALFSPTNGLGLSILRVRIDPTGSASSTPYPWETTSPSDGGNWLEEAGNGAEAVSANPNAIVFASPWTAPAIWKLSGTSTTVSGTVFNEAFNSTCGEGAGYCGGYLDPNHYADYASYLEDFVKFFNTTNSPQHLYAVSMQNEPEENVTYESSVWNPQQMDTWIAGNASTITSDPYSTKLIMPESDSFNPVDASVALSDASAQGLISIIGGHLYGVQPAPYSVPSGDSPKEIWMTEFGPLSNATLTWAQALTTYGESIHNSMVTGQYNAYVWWGVFGSATNSCATAAGTCGLVDDAGNVQPMGYVMGQYSKFIQPGFVRVSATGSPVSGVFVSAYSSSSPSHYAIVIINANSTSESLSFVLNNGSGVTSLTPYQSTSSAGLAAQTAVPVSGGQFSYTLPAQSIVTFYQ
jgi:O-glycosyl hydrolase